MNWCLKKPFASQLFSFSLSEIWTEQKKGARLHTDTFQPQGVEGLLISSVDAALAGQNALLAAESLGYGGVIIGLVRYKSEEVAELFNLPDYTYPVFGMALGVPNQNHDVKPRLPLENVVFPPRIGLPQGRKKKAIQINRTKPI